MAITYYYLAGAMLAIVAGIYAPGYYYSAILFWVAASLGAVSVAYLFARPDIFRKKQDGSIPFYIRWVFVPFLLGVQLYNAWARKNDSVPNIQKIDHNLFLACRLFPSDMPELKQNGVEAILDVTAEFDGMDWSANNEDLKYVNIPVLDHQSPTSKQLMHALNWIDMHVEKKGVVVHCALGRGRSVFIVAAYLLSKNKDWSVDRALETIHGVRKTAGLNRKQLKALEQVRKSGELVNRETLALVANPVSGGGKWPHAKSEIMQRLSARYVVSVYETQKDISAKALTEKAIKEGNQLVVACGGDGTVSEVASVVVDSKVTLGILPLGTTNAFCHVLYGASTKVFPVPVCCDVILRANTQTVDTGKCNNELFLLMACVGLSQKMIASADRTEKNSEGQVAYLKGLWDAVKRNETTMLNISVDDDATFSLRTSSFVVANAAPFSTILAQGGGEPNFKDGLLDITWLADNTTLTEKVFDLSDLATRSIMNSASNENIEFKQGQRVNIDAETPLNYVIDGENRQADKISIQINPNSLKVMV